MANQTAFYIRVLGAVGSPLSSGTQGSPYGARYFSTLSSSHFLTLTGVGNPDSITAPFNEAVTIAAHTQAAATQLQELLHNTPIGTWLHVTHLQALEDSTEQDEHTLLACATLNWRTTDATQYTAHESDAAHFPSASIMTQPLDPAHPDYTTGAAARVYHVQNYTAIVDSVAAEKTMFVQFNARVLNLSGAVTQLKIHLWEPNHRTSYSRSILQRAANSSGSDKVVEIVSGRFEKGKRTAPLRLPAPH